MVSWRILRHLALLEVFDTRGGDGVVYAASPHVVCGGVEEDLVGACSRVWRVKVRLACSIMVRESSAPSCNLDLFLIHIFYYICQRVFGLMEDDLA